jgi:hypothetical protein
MIGRGLGYRAGSAGIGERLEAPSRLIRMRSVAVVCAVALVPVLAGCAGVASGSATGPSPMPGSVSSVATRTGVPAMSGAAVALTGPIYSDAAARARAESVLNLLRLPPRAVRLTASPLHRLNDAPYTPGAGQTLVNDKRWWRVPGTLGQLAAFESAHPPTGFTMDGGGVIDRDLQVQGATPVPGSGAPEVASFYLFALQIRDHVDLLADADVLVTPHRTAVESIPASAAGATLAYDRTAGSAGQPEIHRRRVLTQAELHQIAHVLNALVPYPGLPECPAPVVPQQQSTLTINYDGHRAEFDLSFGCGGVNVLIDGEQQPFLDHDDAAAALTLHLLGVRPPPE